MLKTHWLLPAKLELFDIVRWYESQRAGLGGEFLDELEAVVERIRHTPLDFPRWQFATRRHDVRYAKLRRFPHLVMFETLEHDAWIAAVAHPSRAPRYWIKRLQQIRSRENSE